MQNTPDWQIELEGSELARIEQPGSDMVVVLAAARVPGESRHTGLAPLGGHLQGVRLHLLDASSEGQAREMLGRLDEATWTCGQTGATNRRSRLTVPSSGATPICLVLRSAQGDTLVVRAQAWRIEVLEGGRFTPSLAC